jgi:hypothetical protein
MSADAKYIDRGGQVYTHSGFVAEHFEDTINEQQGITRRDWLAGLAMQGILAQGGSEIAHKVASDAYAYADAMIAQGNAPR